MNSGPAESEPPGPVVVGYDGSRDAAVALDWAAMEAARRGARLRLVTASHGSLMPPSLGFTPVPMVRKAFEAQAEDQARDARQRAERFLPADSVDNAVVLGRAVPTLLEEAAHAGLLVLGHRGRGALASALGSVSMALAERAPCPVVVVRGAVDGGTQPTRPIAVGVDGAEGSSTAVAFAAETAERWGVPLRVVSAWAMVPQLGWDYGTWQAISVSEWRELAGALEESARAAADAAAEQVRSKRPDLPLEAETPELQPTLALEEVSRTSSLLVVGSSGSGALGGLLLGSVSRSLLHHSVCPVAVVKAPGA